MTIRRRLAIAAAVAVAIAVLAASIAAYLAVHGDTRSSLTSGEPTGRGATGSQTTAG